MKYVVRIILSVVVVFIVYLVVYWNVFAKMANLMSNGTAMVCSLVISVLVAALLWKKMGLLSKTVLGYALAGGVIFGILFFSVGFFGPPLLKRGGNLGPLLGFATGPLEVACGFFVGGYFWKEQYKGKS